MRQIQISKLLRRAIRKIFLIRTKNVKRIRKRKKRSFRLLMRIRTPTKTKKPLNSKETIK